jgi:hypothetical protein
MVQTSLRIFSFVQGTHEQCMNANNFTIEVVGVMRKFKQLHHRKGVESTHSSDHFYIEHSMVHPMFLK